MLLNMVAQNRATPPPTIVDAFDMLAAGVKRTREECDNVNIHSLAKRCKLFVSTADYYGLAGDTSTAPTPVVASATSTVTSTAPRKLNAAVEMVRIAAAVAQDDRLNHDSLVELQKMCIVFVATANAYRLDDESAVSSEAQGCPAPERRDETVVGEST